VQQTQERSRRAQDTDREERERRIRELQQQQEEQAQETHHLQQQIEARDQQLQASENQLQEKDRQLEERDRQLEEKDCQLEEKDQAIAHSEQQMRQLQQQHSEQIGRLGNLLSPLHQQITELLEQRDHHVEETQRLRDQHSRQVVELSQQWSRQVEELRRQNSQELEQHSQELEQQREQHSQQMEELRAQHSHQLEELRAQKCQLVEVNQELRDHHSRQVEQLRQRCSQQVEQLREQHSEETQQLACCNQQLREHRGELLGQNWKQAQQLYQLRLELAEKDRQMERKTEELSKNYARVTAQFQHGLMLKENAIRSKQASLSVKDLQIEQLEQQLLEARSRTARGSRQEERNGQAKQFIGREAEGGSQKKRKLEDRKMVEKETSCPKRRRVGSGSRVQLQWREGGRLPSAMNRGAYAADHRVAYFNCNAHSSVYAWDLATQQWSTLPECPQTCFSLEVVNGLLTAIGGRLSGQATNTLLSLTGKRKRKKWSKKFPPMPTSRWATATVCYRDSLIVAGGTSGAGELKDSLATVEVMDTETWQWFTANSLPRPLALASSTICGDHLYVLRGKSAFTCTLLSMHSLSMGAQQKATSPSLPQEWRKIANLPTYYSTCATVHRQLLAVGGLAKDGSKSDAVYRYCSSTNSWEVVSHMPTPRYDCLVAVLPSSELMVVGGGTDDRVLTASIV